MKKTKWILVLALLMAFNLIGCQEAKDPFQLQKDTFLADFNVRWQGLTKNIDGFKALLATAPPELKGKLQAAINQLDEKQTAINKLLADSKDASAQVWDTLKGSLDDTLKLTDLKLAEYDREYWQFLKDQFFKEYNVRLDGLNRKIDEYRALIATAPPEMKDKLQAALNQLDEKQTAIKKMLADSKDATGQAWETLKTSLNDTFKVTDLKLGDYNKEYWQFQKDKFFKEYNLRLDDLNKKIENLKAQIAQVTETKEKLQASLKTLEEKQVGIKKLLLDSKDAIGQAWDNLKARLIDMLKDM